jgi:membrane protease YdiL (CAAX protease family)
VSRSDLPSGGPAPGWVPPGGPAPVLALLWVAVAYAAFQLIVGLLSWRGATLDLVSLGAAEAAAYLAVIFLLLHRYERGTPLRVALALRPTYAGLLLAGAGLGASLKLPAEALTDLVERFFPTSDAQLVARAALYSTDTLGEVLGLSFVTCLLAPLVEELFFRGALYGRLVKVSVPWAGLATGFSFVIVHSDPRHWPALLVVSAALSYLRAASGSLLPSLALHVTFNAAGVLALVMGAVSPTRPLAVPWWASTWSWLVACAVSLWAVLAASHPEARRARREDRP